MTHSDRRSGDDEPPPGRAPMGEWSRGEILDAITEWADRHGDPPAVVDWAPSLARRHGLDERAARWERERWPHANHVRRAFGSWNQAIRAAGLTPRSRGVRRSAPRASIDGRTWTRAEITAAIQAWASEHGRAPTGIDWRHADPTGSRPTAAAAARVFGSWPAALTAAGIDPTPPIRARASTAREQARRLLSLGPTTAAEISRQLGVSRTTARRHVAAALKQDPGLAANLLDGRKVRHHDPEKMRTETA